jgi:hypothetical protein
MGNADYAVIGGKRIELKEYALIFAKFEPPQWTAYVWSPYLEVYAKGDASRIALIITYALNDYLLEILKNPQHLENAVNRDALKLVKMGCELNSEIIENALKK